MPPLPELSDFRSRIDDIDERLLALLGERFAVVREVAAWKAPRGVPAIVPERIEEVRERCTALGSSLGLSPDFVRALYTVIIDEACRLESELLTGGTGA